jgi:hypothetical protein
VNEVPTASVTACTAATVAQLPAVRVLLKSFLDHHPGARFHVLLVDSDGQNGIAVPDGPVEFLHPSAIGVDETQLARLRTAYQGAELANVLRPVLMHWLVGAADTSGPVLHLDPTVLVLAPLVEPILAGLVQRCVVLLPRVLKPLPEDNHRPDAADLHKAGLFDPALIAVNRGAEDSCAPGPNTSSATAPPPFSTAPPSSSTTTSCATPASAFPCSTRPSARCAPTNAARSPSTV